MSTIILRNSDAIVRVRGRAGTVRAGEANGRQVRNISVAFRRAWQKTDENGNDTGQFDDRTQWIEFACWGVAAQRSANIGKGDVVECEFSLADLKPDLYQKDGETKASLKCDRANVVLVAKKSESAPVEAEAPADIEVSEAV